MASFSSFLPSRKASGGGGIGFDETGTQPIAAARANGSHAATDAIVQAEATREREEEEEDEEDEEEEEEEKEDAEEKEEE